MPKDATKNIDRYKIRGGSLNEYEYAENQAALAEQKPTGQVNLIPGTPPEEKMKELRPLIKSAAKKTTKKSARATKTSAKATKSTKSAKASKTTAQAKKTTKTAKSKKSAKGGNTKSTTRGASAKKLAARKAAKKR